MDSNSVSSEGFKKWIKFDLMGEFPLEPGVYIFRVKGKQEPYSEGLSDIVKIGRTERNILERMLDYLDPAIDLEGPKRKTARKVREYMEKGNELEVAWRVIPKGKTREFEDELLSTFKKEHGMYPLLGR